MPSESVRVGIETQSKMMMGPNGDCFHNYRNKLFNGVHTLRFGAARFLFIFAMLNSLAALFALFPA